MNYQFLRLFVWETNREIVFFNKKYWWSSYFVLSPSSPIPQKRVNKAIKLGLFTQDGDICRPHTELIRAYLKHHDHRIDYKQFIGRPILSKKKRDKIKNRKRNKQYGQSPHQYMSLQVKEQEIRDELHSVSAPVREAYQPNKNHRIRYNRGKNRAETLDYLREEGYTSLSV